MADMKKVYGDLESINLYLGSSLEKVKLSTYKENMIKYY